MREDALGKEFYGQLSELAKRNRQPHQTKMRPRAQVDDEIHIRHEPDPIKKSPGPTAVENNQKRPEPLESVDIAIITALRDPEFNQVLGTFGQDWQASGQQNVAYQTAQIKVGHNDLSVVAACQNAMGMVPAALLTQKTISIWRPRIVIMTGICASVPNKTNLGDVVVAKQIFDYGSGKIQDGIIKPDYTPLEMMEVLTNYATEAAYDNETLRAIRDSWPIAQGKPDTELKAHVGPFCSGAAVVADDSIVAGITEHKRSLIGIDMEAYGVATACVTSLSHRTPFLIVKSVQDYANSDKNDDYRLYAAFTSAKFVYEFIRKYWKDIEPAL